MIDETRPLFWGYTITNRGLVINQSGKVLKQTPNNKGYKQVTLSCAWSARKYLVSRLVAHVFCWNPRPDIFDMADHIDRDHTSNVFSNIRWVNRKLNALNRTAKGAYFNKKYQKWCSRVRGKTLGWFKTFEEAHEVSNKHREELFNTLYKKYVCDVRAVWPNTEPRSSICFSETSVRSPTLCY